MSALVFPQYSVSVGDQCPGLPEGSYEKTYDCIMVAGTPCMNKLRPEICAGTVNPDYPDWGPLVWISGTCYCPYTLADKCYGKYSSCPNGCDSVTGECKPAEQAPPKKESLGYKSKADCLARCPDDYAKGLIWACDDYYCSNFDPLPEMASCTNTCGAGQMQLDYPVCTCVSLTANQQCPNGCADYCQHGTQYTAGTCDTASGACSYSETACPDGQECDAVGKACAKATTAEMCNDGIDNDANQLVDCFDPACASYPGCGAIRGRVTMIDNEGERVLEDVPVVATWETANGNAGESAPVYTNSKGEYSIDDPALHQTGTDYIKVTATLVDKSGKVAIDQNFKPVTSTRNVEKESWDSGASQEIVLETANKDENTNPRDAGKMYIHILEANKFYNNLFSQAGSQSALGPEKVEIHYDLSKNGPDAAYHSPKKNAASGIYFGSTASLFSEAEAPNNAEYHEYAHHVMDEALSMPNYHYDRNAKEWVDNNHNGTYNHCSADSWVEGFAEFMSLETQYSAGVPKRCGGQEAYRYCVGSTSFDLEMNYQARGKKEELAVAGILWDLYDNSAIDLGPDDDDVSIGMPDLWNTISKSRSFPDYYGDASPRHIWYVQDLYDAVVEDNPKLVSGINQIFKNHGYYYLNQSSGKEEFGSILYTSTATDTAWHMNTTLAKGILPTDYYIRR